MISKHLLLYREEVPRDFFYIRRGSSWRGIVLNERDFHCSERRRKVLVLYDQRSRCLEAD